MLIDRDSLAYKQAYEKIPEKFRKSHPNWAEPWKEFRGTADEEIGRFLASNDGLLTWKQIFNLIKKKIAHSLKDKDL